MARRGFPKRWWRTAGAAAVLALLGMVGVLGAGCSTGGGGGEGSPSPFARAYRITDRSQLIGGPKAIANLGDFVLENDRIRVAVLGSYESFGPGLYGGALVDADLRLPDGSSSAGAGLDELVEVFPIADLAVQRPGDPDGVGGAGQPVSSSVQVLEAGGSGVDARAVVRVEAELTPLLTAVGIAGPLAVPDLTLVQDYVLEPGRRYVTIRTEARFGEAPGGDGRRFELDYGAVPPTLPTILVSQGLGDVAVLGGTLFSPDFGFDVFSALLAAPDAEGRYDEELPFKNTFAEPLTGELLVGVGNHRSYGITIPAGTIRIPLSASTITPQFYGAGLTARDVVTGERAPLVLPRGSVVTYERYLIVGDGDVGSIASVAHALRGEPTGRIDGRVVEEATGRVMTGASVLLFRRTASADGSLPALGALGPPVSQFTADVALDDTLEDGSFGGDVTPGDYWLVGLTEGHGRSRPLAITVTEGATTRPQVVLPRDGHLRVRVVDAAGAGRPTPAKVTVVELDGHGVPWARFGEGRLPVAHVPREGAIVDPQRVDAARADLELIAAYDHSETGVATFALEPGRYRVYASRGYEHTIDSEDVVVLAGLEAEVQLALARVVDTSGWLSIDMHVHSEGSHDSSCPTEERVRGYVAEGVEILTATDHDFVTDYGPDLERLGMREHLKTIVGDELTTFEVGHYIGFPLVFDRAATANGAPSWLDLPPPLIADALAASGKHGPARTVTMLNHPRDSILGMFSQFGFDQGTGALCAGSDLFTSGNTIIRSGPLGLGDVNRANFCLDCFAAMEVLNASTYQKIRTPTVAEVPLAPTLDPSRPDPPVTSTYAVLTRTMDEQRRILDPAEPFAVSDQARYQGGLDDLFTVLNLGGRVTGVATSDSHQCRNAASGRSWVRVGTDLPGAVDDDDVARAVLDGAVTMGFGAFVTASIDGAGLGETVTDGDGVIDVDIRVQGPGWFQIDRVEVYGNGELAAEVDVPTPNVSTDKYRGTIRFDVRDLAINGGAARDTHVVVVAVGDDSLFPVNFPDDLPAQNVSDILATVFGLGVDPIEPLTYDIHPYAVTNPIFVDVDGDGRFTAVGRPPADGQVKLPPCAGRLTAEECACRSLEAAPAADASVADAERAAARFARWVHALDQIHGRLRAVPAGGETAFRDYP